MIPTLATLPLLAVPAVQDAPPPDGGEALRYDVETYRLDNGLIVTLYEDHTLPQVVVDTWYWVGSKDEAPGRSGFAHLFEHLMFMGTERVPDNEFDVLMESGGGWNNASTSQDRTNYFSVGPSSLLPTLLWLDADRLDALSDAMTEVKLDVQRGVVRNERRQTVENAPYGIERLVLPGLLYPEGHPYAHSVIGSHEDLEAATLEDVVGFFDRWYVPANASLVVAGDFDPDVAKELIERTFGQVPPGDRPAHRTAEPVTLPRLVRSVVHDEVQFPKITLVWHSPAYFAPGDGEMDLLGEILAGGTSSRLHRRLVLETGLAQEVAAYQSSGELGSAFHVEAIAAEGADLEEIRAEISAVIDELVETGPTADELAQVQASMEAGFLRRMESLFSRADRMNGYVRAFGVADGFQRDLERWTEPTTDDLKRWAETVLVPEHVDLRVLPEGMEVPAGWIDEPVADSGPSLLDTPPAPLAKRGFSPPMPVVSELSNGVPVIVIPRPGSGLVSGAVIGRGGLTLMPDGLTALIARMREAGAGGRDAAAFAQAAESLGASISAAADRYSDRVTVSGLASRLDETLDLFADAVLRPNLTAEDFEREKGLHLAAIRARTDEPRAVAGQVARTLSFGADHPSGAPLEGRTAAVEEMTLEQVRSHLPWTIHRGNATFVFAGDVEPAALVAALEARFTTWPEEGLSYPVLFPVVEPPPGRLVLVDRPGAPQTVIYAMRPVPPASGVDRAVRSCLETVLGGSFTSRLNQNLRERNKYSYGAGCRVAQQGGQHLFYATSAVHTPVTAAALGELGNELDAIATGDVSADELAKAIETIKSDLVTRFETTGGTAGALATFVDQGRSPDATSGELAALDGVTLDLVNAMARSGLFDRSTMQIVLVGDAEAVLPQLEEAGFPAPLRADADGDLK